ncbi:hypothetical protein Taro_017041, partial [Colocasia esculenta]|nr:hypothetical protein [Colocasia esculenta]
VVESTSDEDEVLVDNVEPVAGTNDKGKGVAPQIFLLTRRAHHSTKKKKLKVNMKPVIDRLDAHGEILCSLQNEVSSIFVSQSTRAKLIGVMKAELQGLKGELGSIKQLVEDLSVFVREHLPISAPPAPTHAVPESLGPSGPVSVEEVRPPGPRNEEEVRPSGPIGVENSGPSWPKVVVVGLSVKTRTNISSKGSVDTTINGVDTMVQNKGRNVKKCSSSVDTSPGQVDTTSSQVDTRDLSQGFDLPIWDSVSTHLMGRSTHSEISVT